MSDYRRIQSRFGTLWLHRCAALDYGPEWTRRERLLIDAGATESRLNFQRSVDPISRAFVPRAGWMFPFHGQGSPKVSPRVAR